MNPGNIGMAVEDYESVILDLSQFVISLYPLGF